MMRCKNILIVLMAGSMCCISSKVFANCLPTPPGRIEAARGQLLDFSKHALASAQLKLFAAMNRGKTNAGWHKIGGALLSISTDSQGAFDITTLTPGTYFLEITAGKLQRTLLITVTPRLKDMRHEIKVRLLGVECNAFEVTSAQ